MNIFDRDEFNKLKEKYNIEAKEIDCTIKYQSDSYFNRVKDMVVRDRRGEVVFGVVRPNRKIILVTCEDYPKGTYRIPTGGINYGEDISDAIHREAMEELGLKTELLCFGGVIKIKFEYKNEREMFYSYLFLLKEVSGKLLEDATDIEVSEVMEADYSEVEKVSENLDNIVGQWSDWGKFRAVTTKAMGELFKKYIENKL